MTTQEIDFTKTLSDDQVYETIMGNYQINENGFSSMELMNNVYWSFNDHYSI